MLEVVRYRFAPILERRWFFAVLFGICTVFENTETSLAKDRATHVCATKLTTEDKLQTAISGTLFEKTFFGPPNFGEHPETDKKITVWVIRLDYPLSITVGGDIGEKPQKSVVDSIQIKRNLGSAQGFRDLLKRHVVAIGQLQTGVEYDDETPVVIDASVVRIGNKITCGGVEQLPKI